MGRHKKNCECARCQGKREALENEQIDAVTEEEVPDIGN